MATFQNMKINLSEEKEMLHKTLIMAFPFWKRQYPSISLEIENGKIVLIDYKKMSKVVWSRRTAKFFEQIRSAGFFQ